MKQGERKSQIYLGQGTVTNSGVVGIDNYIFGWLGEHPEAYDVPCRDLTLVGQNFETDNPLTGKHEKMMTGAYQAYGTPVTPGQVVKGNAKCNGQPKPEFLWQEHPPLAQAFTYLKKNAGANGFAFSTNPAFGYVGDAFVALFGAFVPVTTGVGFNAHGYRVVRVDPSGEVHDFAKNRVHGPSYLYRDGGLDWPLDITFGPDGSMYIVDWGGSEIGAAGLKLMPLTGAIWRVY